MVAELIQRQLQEIYDLEMIHNVSDFLITDKSKADALDNGVNSRDIDEKLLVFQEQDELWVSLYLAEEILDALNQNNPFECLSESNLVSFCTALEGVSHFTYLTWNAGHERPVSQLEMELQAEVDKFIMVLSLAKDQGAPSQWLGLRKWLFEHCDFDSELKADEHERYQFANNCAANFCERLETQIACSKQDESTYTELRRFYRKRHFDKVNECRLERKMSGP